jgi:hypothetical protein
LLSISGLNLVECGSYNFIPRNQLRRLPHFWRDRLAGVTTLNIMDSVLSKFIPIFNQNHYFVAQKPN